jgi:4-aminobutyrate aminotransferase-like enzyme
LYFYFNLTQALGEAHRFLSDSEGRVWATARQKEFLIVFPALLPTYNRTDVAFVRGEGSYLFAEDGKRYLDFGAG